MDSLASVDRTQQELWKDYLFLTKEMSKFMDENDMDLFYELMEQRERLQAILEETGEDTYLSSNEGQDFRRLIEKENQTMMLKLQYMINKSKNQRKVSSAYDSLGSSFIGNRLDSHR